MTFNWFTSSLDEDKIEQSQKTSIGKLENLKHEVLYFSSFISQLARGAYIASVASPDLTYQFSKLSQVLESEKTIFVY